VRLGTSHSYNSPGSSTLSFRVPCIHPSFLHSPISPILSFVYPPSIPIILPDRPPCLSGSFWLFAFWDSPNSSFPFRSICTPDLLSLKTRRSFWKCYHPSVAHIKERGLTVSLETYTFKYIYKTLDLRTKSHPEYVAMCILNGSLYYLIVLSPPRCGNLNCNRLSFSDVTCKKHIAETSVKGRVMAYYVV
jgi:hypothetical protein